MAGSLKRLWWRIDRVLTRVALHWPPWDDPKEKALREAAIRARGSHIQAAISVADEKTRTRVSCCVWDDHITLGDRRYDLEAVKEIGVVGQSTVRIRTEHGFWDFPSSLERAHEFVGAALEIVEHPEDWPARGERRYEAAMAELNAYLDERETQEACLEKRLADLDRKLNAADDPPEHVDEDS